jgi:hypothetical protein
MTSVRLMPKSKVSLHKLCGCSLHKGKAKPSVTNVGKYVDSKQPKLAKNLATVLSSHGERIAKQASKSWINKMLKADDNNALIRSILDELDINDMSVDVIDSITPELVRAFQAAGILGIGQVGINTTDEITAHLDEAALAYAEDRGAELVKGLTETTTEALRGTLSDAVEEGLSAAELSKSIQESYAFDAPRANTIARTELATAHVQGNVQGWRETGQVEGKEWILGDLHDVDDECDENVDDGVVKLEEAFSSGIKFPPAHPNCICDVLPVLSEGE